MKLLEKLSGLSGAIITIITKYSCCNCSKVKGKIILRARLGNFSTSILALDEKKNRTKFSCVFNTIAFAFLVQFDEIFHTQTPIVATDRCSYLFEKLQAIQIDC